MGLGFLSELFFPPENDSNELSSDSDEEGNTEEKTNKENSLDDPSLRIENEQILTLENKKEKDVLSLDFDRESQKSSQEKMSQEELDEMIELFSQIENNQLDPQTYYDNLSNHYNKYLPNDEKDITGNDEPFDFDPFDYELDNKPDYEPDDDNIKRLTY